MISASKSPAQADEPYFRAGQGWVCFECHHHDAARRLWLIALDLARETEHPLGADLTIYLLDDLTLQAVHLNRPDEAMHLVRIGDTAAVGRNPIFASTACALAGMQAREYALRGDAAACDRALGQAEAQCTRIDPANRPPWGGIHQRGQHVRQPPLTACDRLRTFTQLWSPWGTPSCLLR